MSIVAWLIVGLVAGMLASYTVGGVGYGLIGDIVIGIVGSFLGGWVFGQLGWHAPFKGLAGTIFIAFIGAVIALVVGRLIRRSLGRAR